MNNPIQIIIIDDHPVVLQGFRYLLEDITEIMVVGCFTTALDGLAFLSANNVDIVLLDINLPGMNGMDACIEIKKHHPHTRILAISNNNERGIVMRMLQNGASGYILKNASVEELLACIKDALHDRLVLSAQIKNILAHVSTKDMVATPRLTRREKEVLKLVAEGMTTAAIAEQLFISPLTVETHRRNLMQKFEVNNTASLIRMAAEQQLL